MVRPPTRSPRQALYLNNNPFNENPDQPAALQRRFNYFDYLANGQLQGGITIAGFKMLANTLLPQPDSYVIIDRQRASANGFLVAPTAVRNFVNLQHLLPKFMFVPPSAIAKYRNMSPTQLDVNLNVKPGTALPFYTLFNQASSTTVTLGTPVIRTNTSNGQSFSVAFVPLEAASSSSSSSSSTSTTSAAASSSTSATSAASSTSTSATTSGYSTATTSSPAAATTTSTPASSSTTTTPAAQSSSTNSSTTSTETPATGCDRRCGSTRKRTDHDHELTQQPGASGNIDSGRFDHFDHIHHAGNDQQQQYHEYYQQRQYHRGKPHDNRVNLVDPGGGDDRVSDPCRVQQHKHDTDHDLAEFSECDAGHHGQHGPQFHRRCGLSGRHGHDTRTSSGTAASTATMAPISMSAAPVSSTQTPVQAAAANKKLAAQLAASQKKATEKKSFWTKLWDSL